MKFSGARRQLPAFKKPTMFKILFIAIIGYFILSRLFGRIVIIKGGMHRPENKTNTPNDVQISSSQKDTNNQSGEYIDYEEVK